MLDLHVLGTSSARPTTERAVSGSVLSTTEGLVVMDPGEGFQERFAAARRHLRSVGGEPRLRPRRVGAVLLSHGHLDHTWGLLPWLQTSGLDGRTEPLEVAGPVAASTFDRLVADGCNAMIDDGEPSDLLRQVQQWRALGATSDRLGFPVRWRLGDMDGGRWAVIEDDGHVVNVVDAEWSPVGWAKVCFTPVTSSHSVASCGWRIDHAARQGKVDATRLDPLCLTEDERLLLFRQGHLEQGGERIELDRYRGPGTPSLSLVVSGDTSAPGLIVEGPAPDLMVHEATFLNNEHEKAEAHLHSTSSGAARTAVQSNARVLALTHFSARVTDLSEVLEEAQALLPEDVPCVALVDGDRLRIDAHGAVEHHRRRDGGWTVTRLAESRR